MFNNVTDAPELVNGRLFKTKFVVRAIVGMGSGAIVKKAIQNNVGLPQNRKEAITIPVAIFAMSGMASQATGNYTDSMIDDVASFVDQIKENFDKISSLRNQKSN